MQNPHKMNINIAKYDEEKTDSVINQASMETCAVRWTKKIFINPTHKLINAKRRFYNTSYAYMKKHNLDATKSSVEMLRATFGKCQMIKQYSCKNHIWTFQDPETGVVLHVLASIEGAAFEYNHEVKEVTCAKIIKIINWVTKQCKAAT